MIFSDFFQIFPILGNRTTYRASATSALIGQKIPVLQEAPSCSLLPNNIGHEYVITGIQVTRKSSPRDPNLESYIYIYVYVGLLASISGYWLTFNNCRLAVIIGT
jgi:hypothetical protein